MRTPQPLGEQPGSSCMLFLYGRHLPQLPRSEHAARLPPHASQQPPDCSKVACRPLVRSIDREQQGSASGNHTGAHTRLGEQQEGGVLNYLGATRPPWTRRRQSAAGWPPCLRCMHRYQHRHNTAVGTHSTSRANRITAGQVGGRTFGPQLRFDHREPPPLALSPAEEAVPAVAELPVPGRYTGEHVNASRSLGEHGKI